MVDRDTLMEEYAGRIIQGMSGKELEAYAYDCMMDSLSTYSDEDLLEEIRDTYPDLVDDPMEYYTDEEDEE